MFASDIKEDTILSVKKNKEIPKPTTKPRTASFQEGGNDVAISDDRHYGRMMNTSKAVNNEQINNFGKIPVQLVAPDEVKPTFRTPCATRLW